MASQGEPGSGVMALEQTSSAWTYLFYLNLPICHGHAMGKTCQQLLPHSPPQSLPRAHTKFVNEMRDALAASHPFGAGEELGGGPPMLHGTGCSAALAGMDTAFRAVPVSLQSARGAGRASGQHLLLPLQSC